MQKIIFNLILLCLSLNGLAQKMENVKVSLRLTDVPLKELIRQIEMQTPFTFLARAEDIETELHISINVTNQPLNKLLDEVLTVRKLQYKQVERNIFIKGRIENRLLQPLTPMPRLTGGSIPSMERLNHRKQARA